MTKKRFSTNGYYIYDHFDDGEKWLVNEIEVEEIVDMMNNLDTKARERSKALSTLQKKLNKLHEEYIILKSELSFSQNQNRELRKVLKDNRSMAEVVEENKKLKQHIKGLEKEIYLQHMRSMFSTVKSFKGDVSKRYYYSEKTDTLYDTANNYGQYDKILDKKEIAMLLNEYETLLNGGDLND